MNGPGHYSEAERLLAEAGIVNHLLYVPDGMTQAQVADVKARAEAVLGRPVVVMPTSTEVNTLPVLAAAQVHATLALVAATVASSTSYTSPSGATESYCTDPGWPEAIL